MIRTIYKQEKIDIKNLYLFLGGIFVFIAIVGMGQDFIESIFNGSYFFLSESSLYKVIWLLFIPLLPLGNYIIRKTIKLFSINPWVFTGLNSLIFSVFHIWLTSVMIYILSSLLLDHYYTPYRVFRYFISENFYIIFLIYLAFYFYREFTASTTDRIKNLASQKPSLRIIQITSNNKTILVPLEEIFYVKTARPYIAFVTKEKSYLHNESLKNILAKLNSKNFVRIHRSTIVNINHIACLHSRSNGDYDIEMKNGDIIRMSRNYRQKVKSLIAKSSLEHINHSS